MPCCTILPYLYPGCDAVLHDPVVAGGHVALTHVVALENHRRLVVVEAVLQGTVLVVPAPEGKTTTLHLAIQ